MATLRDDTSASVVIRMAGPRDLEGFIALAKLTGPGFTSLPADEGKLQNLLKHCAAAAQGEPGAILLALEDRESGRVAGCAAVKRGGRREHGFANFRTTCSADGTVQSLTISDDFSGLTEIGGLFVHPDYRNKGVGKPLAQSRYLYLATAPQTFGVRVFAELRGVIDKDGVSPFYDAACKPWLNMSFAEADIMCAAGENDRLVALMPEGTISTEAFSPSARAAIGECHNAGKAARTMLENEGFHFDGLVDLLDGGALVVANMVELTSLKRSRLLRIKSDTTGLEHDAMLVSTPDGPNFRCAPGAGAIVGNAFFCSEDTVDALEVEDGAIVRVAPIVTRAHKGTAADLNLIQRDTAGCFSE